MAVLISKLGEEEVGSRSLVSMIRCIRVVTVVGTFGFNIVIDPVTLTTIKAEAHPLIIRTAIRKTTTEVVARGIRDPITLTVVHIMLVEHLLAIAVIIPASLLLNMILHAMVVNPLVITRAARPVAAEVEVVLRSNTVSKDLAFRSPCLLLINRSIAVTRPRVVDTPATEVSQVVATLPVRALFLRLLPLRQQHTSNVTIITINSSSGHPSSHLPRNPSSNLRQ